MVGNGGTRRSTPRVPFGSYRGGTMMGKPIVVPLEASAAAQALRRLVDRALA